MRFRYFSLNDQAMLILKGKIMSVVSDQTTALSLRLKTETASEHERMHQLMEKADVFASKEKYAQFTLSQYYFQKEIKALFQNENMTAIIPDLDIRGRSDAALLDLKDLNIIPKQTQALQKIAFPQALGWIYVSEGSTLGAAFLFKEAQKRLGFDAEFGARNLAAYPEGRMKVWKRFTQALDEAGFTEQQKDQVVQGALDGFAYFGEHLAHLEQLQ